MESTAVSAKGEVVEACGEGWYFQQSVVEDESEVWGGKYFQSAESKTVAIEEKTKTQPLRKHDKQVATIHRHLLKKSKKIRKEPENQKNQGIFYWTDSNGAFHATNKRVPENVDSFNYIEGVKRDYKRTPVKIIGNAVYVPVTFRNNGVAIKTEMLLDTGCATTLINTNLARQLNLKRTGAARCVVADGRTVSGEKARLYSIEVGPFIDYNLEITYLRHAGADNQGLLGMNFLKNHPFKISMPDKVIIWQ